MKTLAMPLSRKAVLAVLILSTVLVAWQGNSAWADNGTIPCQQAYQQIPKELEGNKYLGRDAEGHPLPTPQEVSAFKKLMRALRNSALNGLQRAFKQDYPVVVYQNGSNVKARYLARALYDDLAAPEKILNVDGLKAEFEKIIADTQAYPEELKILLAKEAETDLQIKVLKDALHTAKEQGMNGNIQLDLPFVSPGATAPTLSSRSFDTLNQLRNEISRLETTLKNIRSSSYETVGSYKNLAANQVNDIKYLQTIRREILNVIEKQKGRQPGVATPDYLDQLLARIDAIVQRNGRIADGYSPPDAAFQKMKWAQLKDELGAALRIKGSAPGKSALFEKVPGADSGGFFSRALRRLSRKKPTETPPAPSSGDWSQLPDAGIPGQNPALNHLKITYADLKKLYEHMTPEERQALHLDRGKFLIGLFQTSKWGGMLTIGWNLVSLGSGITLYDVIQAGVDLVMTTDQMKIKKCAALKDDDFKTCAEKYIDSKFMSRYLNEMLVAKTLTQAIQSTPGVVMDQKSGQLTVDPGKLATTSGSTASGSGPILTRDPSTGLLRVNPDFSLAANGQPGLSNDSKTGNLLIDPARVPNAPSKNFVEKDPATGKLKFNVALILITKSKGMLVQDPRTGQIELDPTIISEIKRLSLQKASQMTFDKLQSQVHSMISQQLDQNNPASDAGIKNWATANAPEFSTHLQAYFMANDPAFAPFINPILSQIGTTTDPAKLKTLLQALQQKAPDSGIAAKACSILSIRTHKSVDCGPYSGS